jgi:hypothetical protein
LFISCPLCWGDRDSAAFDIQKQALDHSPLIDQELTNAQGLAGPVQLLLK